ncbi:MAG: DUF4956 domain-containing protein [Chitinispirillales bacterium]|nr:DUF4956 domain-containing protein [Chitinispirillales bacterium]
MNNFWKTVSGSALAVLALVCVFGIAAAVSAQDIEDALSAPDAKADTIMTPFGPQIVSGGNAVNPDKPGKGKSGKKTSVLMDELLGESDWTFVDKIAIRFVMNVVFAYILICMIFAKEHRIKEYAFCFFISNILIFMVTSLLAYVKVKTGFAFGLFAILSILRYRTEQINIREMTFLFASIIMGVINSMATDGLMLLAVFLADVVLCASIAICDSRFMGKTDQLLLVYDNTGLLAKDKKKELFEDIKNRFGYDVIKVVVTKMNYLTDSAEVKLVYRRS